MSRSFKGIDLTGRTFGRLSVLRLVEGRATFWECSCSCGATINYLSCHLLDGFVNSCGCLRREGRARGYNKKHGHSRGGKTTGEYNSWASLIQRCTNPNHIEYPTYGAAGVKVCQRWLDSFEAFLEDMGPKPTPRHTIDRFPNQSGDYTPDNCRWATQKEQQNNRSNNRHLIYNGLKLTLTQWAERIGISQSLLSARLNRLGWPLDRALTTPAHHSNDR